MKHLKKHRIILTVGLFLLVLFTMTALAVVPATDAKNAPHSGVAPLSPVGHAWHLTVYFLTQTGGSRGGQSEESVMTFLDSGKLTATFPHSSQLSAIDGYWWQTSPSMFHYEFKEPIMSQNKMVMYVRVQIDAFLTSPTTYVAGGLGVAYWAATNQPVGGNAYNVTETGAAAA